MLLDPVTEKEIENSKVSFPDEESYSTFFQKLFVLKINPSVVIFSPDYIPHVEIITKAADKFRIWNFRILNQYTIPIVASLIAAKKKGRVFKIKSMILIVDMCGMFYCILRGRTGWILLWSNILLMGLPYTDIESEIKDFVKEFETKKQKEAVAYIISYDSKIKKELHFASNKFILIPDVSEFKITALFYIAKIYSQESQEYDCYLQAYCENNLNIGSKTLPLHHMPLPHSPIVKVNIENSDIIVSLKSYY